MKPLEWIIGRLRCYRSPEYTGTPTSTFDPASADWYREHGWTVVEFVPAGQLREAVEALEECVRLSGADLSGGFPTSPDLPTYAVQCVRELRKDYDDALGGL